MTTWGERIAAPILAATAAAWWGFALTVLQPAIEAERAGVPSVGNNAYWVREVRWTMILLALVAFVWACRGDRRRSGLAVVGALAWIGVDVWLDRIDLTGTWVAFVAGALAAAACIGAARRPRHDRPVLVLAATTAALAAMVGAVQSPGDTEPGLVWSGCVGAGLAVLLALGCAVSAAPGRRAIPIAVLPVSAVLIAVMWLPFPGEPASGLAALALTAILLWTVMLRVWTPPGGVLGAALALPSSAAALFIAGFLLIPLVLLNLGAPFTALAGNPPVNPADTDSLNVLLTLVVGLAAGVLCNFLASRSAHRSADALEPA